MDLIEIYYHDNTSETDFVELAQGCREHFVEGEKIVGCKDGQPFIVGRRTQSV